MEDLKKELIKEQLEGAQKELIKAELWIDLYEALMKDEKDAKIKAQHGLKVEGLKKTIKFNEKVIKHFS